jgi:ADP-ribose pyrophosphatase
MTKLLSRTPVHKGFFFTTYKDEVELLDGTTQVFDSGIRQPSVGIIPLTENNEIILVDQYRYMLDKRIIEMASGMIDEGEDPLTAAKRELKEELGIVAKTWISLKTAVSAPSILTWENHIFVARDLAFEEQELETSEDITMVKIPLADAVERALNGEISHAVVSLAILVVNEKIKRGEL